MRTRAACTAISRRPKRNGRVRLKLCLDNASFDIVIYSNAIYDVNLFYSFVMNDRLYSRLRDKHGCTMNFAFSHSIQAEGIYSERKYFLNKLQIDEYLSVGGSRPLMMFLRKIRDIDDISSGCFSLKRAWRFMSKSTILYNASLY